MTICSHKFIRINDATKPRPGSISWSGQIGGARAGCIECGQIRQVFEDGTLSILHPGGPRIEVD